MRTPRSFLGHLADCVLDPVRDCGIVDWPMHLFVNYLTENPQFFLSWVIAITFSICVHEWAHAFTALKCGDDTAERAGHLTLNPLVQMGPASIFYLLILGIAWGAVPVDVSQLRKRWHEPLVSFAGPLSNLILCALLSLITVVLMAAGQGTEPLGRRPLLPSAGAAVGAQREGVAP